MRKPLLFKTLHGERTGFIRPVLMALLFVGVGALYWWHMGNRIADIADADLQDRQKIFTKEQRKHLRQERALLQQETGVRCVLHLEADGTLHVPKYDASAIFMGMGLRHKEAVVVFPPIVQRALGEGVRLDLEDNLRQCLREDHEPALCFTQGMEGVRQALLETPQ